MLFQFLQQYFIETSTSRRLVLIFKYDSRFVERFTIVFETTRGGDLVSHLVFLILFCSSFVPCLIENSIRHVTIIQNDRNFERTFNRILANCDDDVLRGYNWNGRNKNIPVLEGWFTECLDSCFQIEKQIRIIIQEFVHAQRQGNLLKAFC